MITLVRMEGEEKEVGEGEEEGEDMVGWSPLRPLLLLLLLLLLLSLLLLLLLISGDDDVVAVVGVAVDTIVAVVVFDDGVRESAKSLFASKHVSSWSGITSKPGISLLIEEGGITSLFPVGWLLLLLLLLSSSASPFAVISVTPSQSCNQ